MSFNHENGYEAVKFDAGPVSGMPAVSGYLLRFTVEYSAPPWNPTWGDIAPTFRNVVGKVEVGDKRIRLGTATPERPFIICPHKYPENSTILFELLLSTPQIESLERLRAGGSLDFALKLSGERSVGYTHTREDTTVNFRVEQSKWVDVLQQMGYGIFLLCEIPIELGKDGKFREAWAALDRARKLVYSGNFNSVVVECRIALEAAFKTVGLTERVRSAAKKRSDDPMAMTKRERLLDLVGVVQHACQLSVHVDDAIQVVEYSRDEALLIYGATAASISDIAAGESRKHELVMDDSETR